MSGPYQVSGIDSRLIATVTEEMCKREEQQRRHYAYLHELQELTKELPSKYQQRMTHDLLVNLANSLLDDTIFQIISGMAEVQKMEEENLFNNRKRILAAFDREKMELLSTHKDRLLSCINNPSKIKLVEQQNREDIEKFEQHRKEEISRTDEKIILKLDERLHHQQTTLMKAGLAGFYCTKEPDEITLQMKILDFINRLSSSGI